MEPQDSQPTNRRLRPGEEEHRITLNTNQVVGTQNPPQIRLAVSHLPDTRNELQVISVRIFDASEDIDEQTLIQYAQSFMYLEVSSEIRTYFRNHNITDRDPADTAGVLTLDNGRFAAAAGKLGTLLRGTKVADLLESISQSNEFITVYDFTMTFRVSISSLRGGSGAAVTTKFLEGFPKWYGNSNGKKYWQNYYFEEGGVALKISCAVIAVHVAKQYHTLKKLPEKFTRPVMRQLLQNQRTWGWGDFVTIDQILALTERDEYKDFRITVIDFSKTAGDFSSFTSTGENFVNEVESYPDRPPKNCLYIYRHNDPDHYMPVTHPDRLFHRYKNYQWSFCHKCIVLHPIGAKNHACSTRRRPPIKCVFCHEIHEKPADCPLAICRDCHVPYERNEKNSVHRCLIMPRTPNRIIDTEGDTDPKKTGLYAWDIESQLEADDCLANIPVHGLDENHLFTAPMYVKRIRRHIPIYVCAKNVFTNKQVFFEGSDCMTRFVDWAMTVNKGNNIFIAHNSSGYDSRLLLHELYNSRKDFKITTIKQGEKTIS